MTVEEHDALIDKMKEYAGCASCKDTKCRACLWDDAMDCIDDFYESLNLGFICSALIVASIVIPTVITKFRRDT